MTLKLPDELREALQQTKGRPVDIEDDHDQKMYVLVEKEAFRQMVDAELRRQLQLGFDQADAGEVEEWNADEFRDRMHRQHEAQNS